MDPSNTALWERPVNRYFLFDQYLSSDNGTVTLQANTQDVFFIRLPFRATAENDRFMKVLCLI